MGITDDQRARIVLDNLLKVVPDKHLTTEARMWKDEWARWERNYKAIKKRQAAALRKLSAEDKKALDLAE